jgi:hypothetical protein
MIPRSSWKWYGNAGHLVVSEKCRFHLATTIGDLLVSTVGDYFPDGNGSQTEIGSNRMYETMVFSAKELCECGCGMPEIDGNELECVGYNDRAAANVGHMEMCLRAARGEIEAHV